MNRSKLINPMDHVGLVKKIVHQIAPNADEFLWDDLYQEGMIGCIDAARKFKPELGYKFSSYAVPTIAGYIRHYLRDKLHVIRPHRKIKEVAQVLSLDYKMRHKDGTERSLFDTLAAPGVDVEVNDVRGALDWLDYEDANAAHVIRLTIGGGDMKQNEVAAKLGISPITVGRRIKRGVKKMKAMLEEDAA
jgi:RNA polymerase sigma factor (sigma-70 family)